MRLYKDKTLFAIYIVQGLKDVKQNPPQNALRGISAEGTRFELVVQNNPYGSLANCWFQPLTHPSGLKALETPPKRTGLQRYNFLCKVQIFYSSCRAVRSGMGRPSR